MTHRDFDTWLKTYGAAWEAKDAEAFAGLFTEDARYYWTPFEEPKKGRQGVAEAFSNAVTNQRDIHFSYEILAVFCEIGDLIFCCPPRNMALRNCHKKEMVLTKAGPGSAFG